MLRLYFGGIACLIVIAAAVLLTAPAPAAEIIVPYGPRTPAEEKSTFKLPPGFEAQLVASEPDIHKPLNIAFDDRGRLWVTDTVEYPFAAEEGKGRDSIKILEDFAPNGKARKITTFASGLNIPIGVIPQEDGAIAHSIPYIWKFTDTNKDGKADDKKILFGPIGFKDTHGMTNSFLEGFDGWIYACHGFLNDSTFRGADGSELQLNSGNTYRFRADGARAEAFAHGQVNPFGLAFDEAGDLYSADCSSKPITLLLRGAYYFCYDKPDDGLGFGPNIMNHQYGITAICGLAIYNAEQFPAEHRGRLFVGNVGIPRIHQASLQKMGSSYWVKDHPMLLEAGDEWFRPVCIQLGPDGALYVADWYNRIIAHEEVAFDHPARDKTRGRIWRIVYTGKDAPKAPAKKFDLSKESTPLLITRLSDPNFTIRMFAMNRLANVVGQQAVAPVKNAVKSSNNTHTKVHGLWALARLNALDDTLAKTLAKDDDNFVRVHLIRAIAERKQWSDFEQQLALAALTDDQALVQRVAADAIGRHPTLATLKPLLAARALADPKDTMLMHTIRMAIRDHLMVTEIIQYVSQQQWNAADADHLADAAAGAATPQAASFLLRHLQTADVSAKTAQQYIQQVARYAPPEQMESVSAFVTKRFADDVDLQLSLFESVRRGLLKKGSDMPATIRSWGVGLAERVLKDYPNTDPDWWTTPLPGSNTVDEGFHVRQRKSTDRKRAEFLFSNEEPTGVLRSRDFTIPESLEFWIGGRNIPGSPPPTKTLFRLRLAENDAIAMETMPPRNDDAIRMTWNLRKFAGKQGYFELVDGDDTPSGNIGIGRMNPEVVKLPRGRLERRDQMLAATEIAAIVKADAVYPLLSQILSQPTEDLKPRIAAAAAMGQLQSTDDGKSLLAIVTDAKAPDVVREAAAGALSQVVATETGSAEIINVMAGAPARLQTALARPLASSAIGAEALLNAVMTGKVSPALLQDRAVVDRFASSRPKDWEQRVEQLTRNLPPADAQVQKLIDERTAKFDPAKASIERGGMIFQKNCAVCHTLGGQGGNVGPTLDGVGKRGVARVLEDILDPSRNVDAAFRYSTFMLKGSKIVDGLIRADKPDALVLVNAQGKEEIVVKKDIQKRRDSTSSLMPSNFHEILPPQDLDDLLAFLLTK